MDMDIRIRYENLFTVLEPFFLLFKARAEPLDAGVTEKYIFCVNGVSSMSILARVYVRIIIIMQL